MLITKFNRMIRSRVLWGAFAILISVAFVFTFSEVGGCENGAARRGAVGVLFDRDVTGEEFRQARFFELGLRGNVNLPPEAEHQLADEVWKRLATLRTAERLAVRVGDAELAETIQRDRSFWVGGAFSPQQYKQAIQRQLGVGVSMFEDFLRQQQTLDKMQQLASSMTWIAPLELSERLGDLTDERSAAYVLISKDKHTPPVTVTDDEVRAFFVANTNLFVEPERVSVRYVSFDVANFIEQAAPTESDVTAYYEEHRDLYASVDTNEVQIVKPLDEVREEIEELLRRQAARDGAMAAATELAVALAPGRYTPGTPFDEAAAHAGLAIHTTAVFGASEQVGDLDVGDAFRRAAFDLDVTDKDFYFSDAVAESNAVYVLATDRRVPPFVPEFDDVRAAVVPRATSNAVSEAFAARVSELHGDVLNRLGNGESFADAASALGLNVVTTGVFSVYMGLPEETPYADMLPSALMSITRDRLSKPTPVENGILLVYEQSRTQAEPGVAQFLRPQLLQSLKRFRAAAIFNDWRQSLLAEGGFEDLSNRTGPSDDERRQGEAPGAGLLF